MHNGILLLPHRPDSITGWFKYTPQPDRYNGSEVVLHRGYGKQPDNDYLNNWIGQAHFRFRAIPVVNGCGFPHLLFISAIKTRNMFLLF